VISEDVLPKEIQILAPCKEIRQKEYLRPLESGIRVESEKLEGESEEGPWEILLLPFLSLFLG
jgi:hypothetical protein